MAMIVPKVDVKKKMKTHIDCVTTMILVPLRACPTSQNFGLHKSFIKIKLKCTFGVGHALMANMI
jgi:hypothetical protein